MSDAPKMPVQARFTSSGLSIGALARLTGVAASAIRYYEACNILPAPARRSGRRCYDRSAVSRVMAIVAARASGFSIRELRDLAATDSNAWRDAAKAKVASLKAKIAGLQATTARLDALSGCDCNSGPSCALLTRVDIGR